MSWDRNNLAPHALPSILCDSFSSSSAGLNLGVHLGRFGMFPVDGNGLNTSAASAGKVKIQKRIVRREYCMRKIANFSSKEYLYTLLYSRIKYSSSDWAEDM